MRAMTPRISRLALWRSFRRVLGFGTLVALIWLGTGSAVVVQAGRSDQSTADAAIVMLDDDGAPTRIDYVRQLYSEGNVSRILLAGTEIGTTRETLQKRGIKEDAIIELRADDQLGQLTAAKATLQQEHLRSAVLIAEPVETLRLLKIAHDADLRLLSTPVGARSDISISGIIREVGRYFRYVLLNQ
jgi:hypothetical protein